MTSSTNEPEETPTASEPGYITDDQLPEDLRPTDDNPLAKNPDEDGDDSEGAQTTPAAEGMPDMGSPGAQP